MRLSVGYNFGMELRKGLLHFVTGDIADDAETRRKFSRDTSIFERPPAVVVYPKDAQDVAAIVRFAHTAREHGEKVSVTGRSAGTDMTGGPLNDSIILSFTKYMNHMIEIGDDYAIAEPGLYYRDFERQTLARNGKLLPSYPASRELCAIGGIVSNNSAGELTLRYGKTERYIAELNVVLSDGSPATLRALTRSELNEKKALQTLEGDIYRRMHELIEKNSTIIEAARPKVSKNSSGYALWNVYDKRKDTFDLTKVIAGSQGTLAMVTRAKLNLVKTKEHRAMVVMFLSDLNILPEIVHRVLKFDPESFESYDDHVFQLAVRLLPQMLKQLGLAKAIRIGLAFLPEVGMVIMGGVPKLILMAEFAEDSQEAAREKAREVRHVLSDLSLQTKLAFGASAEKYWTIRRETFALLRKNSHGLYAAPFIDDFVVDPDTYPKFLPELNALLSEYDLIYTISGHVGNGNFHIIPLMNLADPKAHHTIDELTTKVCDLVIKYHGSITGEHNDGIIRTPYVEKMFGSQVYELFKQTKHIFDPLNVFNPGKKVGGQIADIEKFMIKKI